MTAKNAAIDNQARKRGHRTSTNSYADLAERLFGEFEPAHGLDVVSEVMQRCRADLFGTPRSVRLKLLEALARERLSVPQVTAGLPRRPASNQVLRPLTGNVASPHMSTMHRLRGPDSGVG